jgi:hypothetical protein
MKYRWWGLSVYVDQLWEFPPASQFTFIGRLALRCGRLVDPRLLASAVYMPVAELSCFNKSSLHSRSALVIFRFQENRAPSGLSNFYDW